MRYPGICWRLYLFFECFNLAFENHSRYLSWFNNTYCFTQFRICHTNITLKFVLNFMFTQVNDKAMADQQMTRVLAQSPVAEVDLVCFIVFIDEGSWFSGSNRRRRYDMFKWMRYYVYHGVYEGTYRINEYFYLAMFTSKHTKDGSSWAIVV